MGILLIVVMTALIAGIMILIIANQTGFLSSTASVLGGLLSFRLPF